MNPCDQCTVAPATLIVTDREEWSGFMRVCDRCQSILERDGSTRTVRRIN
jgi:hypothetical protein